MSNRKHRFSLHVVKRKSILTGKTIKRYLILVEKGGGNLGKIVDLGDLKHSVKYHSNRTRDFAVIDAVHYLTSEWTLPRFIGVDHIGNFESIQDIIDIIEVLQL